MPNLIEMVLDKTDNTVCLVYNRQAGIAIDSNDTSEASLRVAAEASLHYMAHMLAGYNSDDENDVEEAEDIVCTYFFGIVTSEFELELKADDSQLVMLGSFTPDEQITALFEGVVALIYTDDSSHEQEVKPTLH